MCFKNSLEPCVVPDCLKNLSNLEKQLIVKNLIFIKIRQLPKTRMDAMNDRVINVPIDDDNIAKRVTSLPRTEENSGMVNIGIKRKLNMKNYHKHGLINPDRVFKACQYLIKHHPDYKNIKLANYDDWVKKCPSNFIQATNSEDEDSNGTGNSSDEEQIDQKKKDLSREVECNDYNATTCLYLKEPSSDMIVNHSKIKKKIKLKRLAKKIHQYAPGRTCF